MKRELFIGLLVLISINIKAQLVVNTGTMTPTQYVQNVLVGGGVAVSNVTFFGAAGQLGDFDSQNANVGINQGLVLSSGNVVNSVGPNNDSGFGTSDNLNGPGDPDLQALSGIGMNDVAILEFDFIPSGDSIKFNYVFGSEEYMEWVGGGVNDAFGFFLSGPGIAGPFSNSAVNLAKIPGTNTAVSIDDVNAFTNQAYYIDNGDGNSAPFNADPQYVQYDGLTVTLVAEAQVQCGQLYHIKIAIADGGDGSLNSGVFLEGGSFSSNEIAIDISVPTLDVVNGMPAVIEGCSEAIISFTRSDISDSLVITFNISGDAINGSDYAFIPDSIKFNAGEDSVAIVITPFIDGPDDFGQDTVTISYISINACGDTLFSTGSFLILDVPNLVVDAPDLSICPVSNTTLTAEAAGAVPPFVYNWVNTSNDTIQTDSIHGISSLSVPGLVSDTYYLYVTDSCNLITTTDTINIYVNDDMASISTTGDTTLFCAGQTISIGAFPDDLGNVYDYEWFDQIGGVGIDNDSVLTVSPVATITYYVTATNVCNGSTDTDTVNVIVDYTPIEITSITNDTTFQCLGVDYNLDLYSVVQNGTLPYSFGWTGDASSSDSLFQVTMNTPSTYYLEITDACSLKAYDTVVVTFAPYVPMSLTTPTMDSICSGSEAEVSVRVFDGLAPYTISWNNGDTGENIVIETSGSSAIPVEVNVTDNCGQQISTVVEIPIKLCDVIPMNVITPNGDGMNEFVTFINLENYENSKLNVFNRWGKSVYSSDNYKNDWDGGKLNDGTYFYVLEVNDSKSTILKGTFTLLK
ncbi:gliding motility-associated C-terminal domain-containing protein [Vicingus serpentipes]|uniref:Gliding motility-associated C-terminal domain-containing protein n=1 Tax=Vicingus serpentipes TaxID=1926625 RepID=A0A5C6RUY7_9FLAO|nr:choice-of-anchor L domain-containing protein [Vicingus serpentipes]TXB65340.1 gliding motility-associated C-terminal domain-containing protein [Vicingus serpentipes]